MNIKAEQIKALKPYIKNIDRFVNDDDFQGLLNAVDDVIVDNILGNNDEPDAHGIKLQKLYDELYSQN